MCPHCGFTNKPGGARCECCLGELAEASAAPLMETQPPAEAAPEPEPSPLPPPPEAPPPTSPSDTAEQLASTTGAEASPVPAPSPRVPRAAKHVIIGLVVVGALGGLWLVKSQLGTSQPLSGRLGISTEPEAVQPGEPSAPAAPTETAAELAPSPPGPSSETAPVVSPEDEAAEVRYQIVLNLLRKGQNAQARQTLQEVIQKYPNSRFTQDARSLLKQIPEPRPSPARRPAAVARATRPSAVASPRPRRQAPGPVADRYPSEGASEGKSSVITTDDLLEGRSGARTTRRRKQASIPPSLRAAQVRPAQSASAAARDNVRLISLTRQPGKVVALLQYRLASQHQRPVLVGAWALSGGSARNFSYSASPIAPGQGTTTVTLSGVSPDLSRLRIAFFEQGGQRFFTKDLTVPK